MINLNIGSNFDQEVPVGYMNWKSEMAKMCPLQDEMCPSFQFRSQTAFPDEEITPVSNVNS